MKAEEVIRTYSGTPSRESIGPVVRALVGQTLLVPIKGGVPDGPGQIHIYVGHDRFGRLWAYGYTSAVEIGRAFPQGCDCASTDFRSLFQLIESNPALTGGLMINSKSDTSFPISRELIDSVKQALQEL